MSDYQTQGRRVIEALMRRPHTYMEMLHLGVSTCPQKRVAECLRAHEKIVKGSRCVGGRDLTTWQVVRNESV
jgi:hypothetical protein